MWEPPEFAHPLTVRQKNLVEDNLVLADDIVQYYAKKSRKLRREFDCEEFKQDAYLSLMKAAKLSKPVWDVHFKQFAWTVIKNDIKVKLREIEAENTLVGIGLPENYKETPDKEEIAPFLVDMIITEFYSTLTTLEKQLITLRFGIECEALKLEKISEKVNLDISQVSVAISNIFSIYSKKKRQPLKAMST